MIDDPTDDHVFLNKPTDKRADDQRKMWLLAMRIRGWSMLGESTEEGGARREFAAPLDQFQRA